MVLAGSDAEARDELRDRLLSLRMTVIPGTLHGEVPMPPDALGCHGKE